MSGATTLKAAVKPNFEWLNTAKAVGIVLLVYLHVKDTPANLYDENITWGIRLFRMPMFFVISGFLFSPTNTSRLAEKKFYSLIVPYIAYTVLILAAVHIRSLAIGKDDPFLSPKGLLFLALGGEYMTKEFGVFWFITCLFVTQLTMNVLIIRFKSLFSLSLLLSISMICTAGYILEWAAPNFRSPLALGIVPFGLPLFWFGAAMRSSLLTSKQGWILFSAVLLSSAALASLGVPFAMNLKYGEAGPPVFGIALAGALTWLFLQLCRGLSQLHLLKASTKGVADASVTIMFMHQLVHHSARDLGITSDTLIIALSLIIPFIFWCIFRRSEVLSALFIGTSKRPSLFVKDAGKPKAA